MRSCLHHTKTLTSDTSTSVPPPIHCARCSICLGLLPMQEVGCHCAPPSILLCPHRAEERKRCEKMQWSFLSCLPEQDVLWREEAEGLMLAGELHQERYFYSPSPSPYWNSPQAGGKGRILPASEFSEQLFFSGRWVNQDSIHSERIPTPLELICKSSAYNSSCKICTSSRWGFMIHTESCTDLRHWQRNTAEINEPNPPPLLYSWSPCIHFTEIYPTSTIHERRMEKKEVVKLGQLPGETQNQGWTLEIMFCLCKQAVACSDSLKALHHDNLVLRVTELKSHDPLLKILVKVRFN